MALFNRLFIIAVFLFAAASCGVKRDMAKNNVVNDIDKYNRGKIIINEPRTHY